jgi:hypothetical protein
MVIRHHVTIDLEQGVCYRVKNGRHREKNGRLRQHTEYAADEGTHLASLRALQRDVRAVQRRRPVTVLMLSGSRTQPKLPDLSEAESAQRELPRDGWPAGLLVGLDALALDTPENISTGCMNCRLLIEGLLMPVKPGVTPVPDSARAIGQPVRPVTPTIPIAHVTLRHVWRVKSARIGLVATALGIKSFDTQGFSSHAAAATLAVRGEAKFIAEIHATQDWLQLGKNWEAIRRRRYQGTDEEYRERLSGLRAAFPRTWAAIDELAAIIDRQQLPDYARLQQAFAEEVIG